jgi:hypothetical protein
VYSGWKEKDFVSVVESEALKEEDEDYPCPLRMMGSTLVEVVPVVHSAGNTATRWAA